MLTLIQGLPDHVGGIKATNEVTKEDVDNVLLPALDKLVNATVRIHYCCTLIPTSQTGTSAPGLAT